MNLAAAHFPHSFHSGYLCHASSGPWVTALSIRVRPGPDGAYCQQRARQEERRQGKKAEREGGKKVKEKEREEERCDV